MIIQTQILNTIAIIQIFNNRNNNFLSEKKTLCYGYVSINLPLNCYFKIIYIAAQ